MPAILTLEATGSKGEELAMKAGEQIDITVGWDSEFNCATFDAEELDDEQLQTTVFDALGRLDPDWQSQLKMAE
jgi:hypothetical protein